VIPVVYSRLCMVSIACHAALTIVDYH